MIALLLALQAAAPADEPAPPPLSAAAIQAKAGMNGAMDFVSSIYRHLPDYNDDAAPYAPRLAALIARDKAYSKATGRDGPVDWIPLCGCKEFGEQYHLTKLTARTSTAGGMAVDARIWVGSAIVVTLDLARVGSGWQITDIHTPRAPSLLAALESAMPVEDADLRNHPPAPHP